MDHPSDTNVRWKACLCLGHPDSSPRLRGSGRTSGKHSYRLSPTPSVPPPISELCRNLQRNPTKRSSQNPHSVRTRWSRRTSTREDNRFTGRHKSTNITNPAFADPPGQGSWHLALQNIAEADIFDESHPRGVDVARSTIFREFCIYVSTYLDLDPRIFESDNEQGLGYAGQAWRTAEVRNHSWSSI